MTVSIALVAAFIFGVGDFCGGLAARRSDLLAVLFLSHLLGLAGMVACSVIFGGTPTTTDLVAGATAGLAGGLGVAMLYRALASGVMALVAPITAVIAAIVPVIAGLLLGERLSVTALAGIGIAVAAVALLSGGPSGGQRISPGTLLLAIGSGLAFAGFYIAFSRAGAGAGLWPLVAARCASVSAFVIAIGVTRRVPRTDRPGLALILTAGVFDVGANALYLVAVHRGLLSIVAVLVSLYPASTVLCAFIVLGERLNPIQLAGVAGALVAVTLIGLG